MLVLSLKYISVVRGIKNTKEVNLLHYNNSYYYRYIYRDISSKFRLYRDINSKFKHFCGLYIFI